MAATDLRPRQTNAFVAQCVIAFALSLGGMTLGIAYLPVPAWPRAFLALGLFFVVSSSLTLAKCVRDLHEGDAVTARVDEARLQQLLASHDPFRQPVM